MEAVKCLHREKIDYTEAVPGVEIGVCSKCGQTIQYDHNGMQTKVTVTRLGRLDGNIVLPKNGLQSLLSAEDQRDLDAALAHTPEPSPAPTPRKGEKRKGREQYWEQNKEAIIYDYYLMKLLDFFKRWGLSSHSWKILKSDWKVTPKGKRNRYTTGKKKPESSREPKPTSEPGKALPPLPSFPQFNEEWTPAVKIEWFKAYKELRLASEEK